MTSRDFLEALRAPEETITVELRPPRTGLSGHDTLDAWIETYHGVRRLAGAGHFLFLTDNAVGAAEEENLAHLGANLADEVDPGAVIPFLTAKHSMEYCLMYAQRAWARGFRALAVLGGDKSVGPPRCVPHAYQLRSLLRQRVPGLTLGGWANPHADPAEQAAFLAATDFTAEFWLSQVVSHHSAPRVESLLEEAEAHGVRAPGVFGVFFYRSANPSTLERLAGYFPVPAAEITREVEAGATPEEICARSLRALRNAGAQNVYISNLPLGRGLTTLNRVLDLT